ncbi:hypothetical protein FQ154_12270 [Paeniglutamicibacter gangotriensis]|uniref:Uncharacterized protein n=1 Tax=Paeniglutamicibacter gangotriensis TaxID=254787 RepID=A0A5B0EAM4_9MICC|nr:hypothetical protein FQ154_12270 [Paeniglutamicibacter gangotriensis]
MHSIELIEISITLIWVSVCVDSVQWFGAPNAIVPCHSHFHRWVWSLACAIRRVARALPKNHSGLNDSAQRKWFPEVLGDLSISAISAGCSAAAVSCAGSMLVIIQVAARAGLDKAQTAFWVWAVSGGSGDVARLLSSSARASIVVD